MENKYAIFLDVDGVINSLNHLFTGGDIGFSAETTAYRANGYTVWIPEYVKEIVQAFYTSTDLYWLTTWRDNANEWISPILGIPTDIPVIDDGSQVRETSWKYNACRDLAKTLHESGQKVYWIEDFSGHRDYTLTPYLTFVDTDQHGEGVLLPQHLPVELQNHIIEHGAYTGPTYLSAPSRKEKISYGTRNFGVNV